jgi:hypothetical protein
MKAVAGTMPDAVVLAGLTEQNGAQLIKDKVAVLGPNDGMVKLFAPDGFAQQSTIDLAGSASKGMFASVPGRVPENLEGPGAKLVSQLRKETTGPVELHAPYAGQAASVLLDAIARSGERSGVLDAVRKAKVTDGITGSFRILASGSTPRLDEVQADQRREKHDDGLHQEAMQCLEAIVHPFEARVDLGEAVIDLGEARADLGELVVDAVEATFHLSSQRPEFGPHLHSQPPEIGIDAIEAGIHLVVEVVEALVGPALSHRLHDATLADRTLRVGRVSAKSLHRVAEESRGRVDFVPARSSSP